MDSLAAADGVEMTAPEMGCGMGARPVERGRGRMACGFAGALGAAVLLIVLGRSAISVRADAGDARPMAEGSSPTPIPTITLPPQADYSGRLAPLEPGAHPALTNIQMVDRTRGWAVDEGGHILRTEDGGRTWKNATPPEGRYSVGGFFAVDGQSAWATKVVSFNCIGTGESSVTQDCLPLDQGTRFGVVWRTSDGGQTWLASRPFYLASLDYSKSGDPLELFNGYEPYALRFSDSKHGWLMVALGMTDVTGLEYFLYRTRDGGQSWEYVTASPVCFMRGMEFADAKTGYYLGDCEMTPYNNWGPYLEVTTDGGDTWQEINISNLDLASRFPVDSSLLQEYTCYGTKLIRTKDGLLAAGVSCEFAFSGFLLLRSDGSPSGKAWLSSKNVMLQDLGEEYSMTTWSTESSETFADATHGWRLFRGVNRLLQVTEDGGSSWKSLGRVTWESALFDFLDPLTGWVLTDPHTIRFSEDGGRTWRVFHPVVQ